MDELVDLVVKKTGLPKETARSAVTVVLDYLKKKLPPPVGSTIDSYLSGKGDLASAANLLGGLMGGSKKKK
ncbi:MAG: hypothetical protein L6Q26_04865 [Anaerolineales bacterium]|nr:hypothetical protein [Anaerolineales bacterium]NUQ85878.1 hypothetical protein [Anaerolineales bacterium]